MGAFAKVYLANMKHSTIEFDKAESDIVKELIERGGPINYMRLSISESRSRYLGIRIYNLPRCNDSISVYHNYLSMPVVGTGINHRYHDPYRSLEDYILRLFMVRGVLDRDIVESIQTEPNVFDDELPPVYDGCNVYCGDERVGRNSVYYFGTTGIDEDECSFAPFEV